MRATILWLAIALGVSACGDPESNDDRSYTKAPLEDPGLLVGGEPATAMASLGRPIRPRARVIEPEAAEGAEAGAEQQVALAPGVTQEQFDQGRQLFTGQAGCQACHGPNAQGTQLGPDLTDAEWLHISGPDVGELATVIRTGVPQPQRFPAPMPAMGGANLNDAQLQALAGYIASLAQS